MLRTLGLRVPGEAAVTHISLGRDRRNRLFLPPQPRAARATHAGRQAEVVGARSRARLATGISLGRGLGGEGQRYPPVGPRERGLLEKAAAQLPRGRRQSWGVRKAKGHDGDRADPTGSAE